MVSCGSGTIPECPTVAGVNAMMLIPQKLDGFDVEDAVARMLDRPELWWQAVGFFVHHFSDWKDNWENAIGNDVAERRQVHAIRSAAANVGAKTLADQAERMEQLLLRRLDGSDVDVPVLWRDELAAAFDIAWGCAARAWQDAGSDLPELS